MRIARAIHICSCHESFHSHSSQFTMIRELFNCNCFFQFRTSGFFVSCIFCSSCVAHVQRFFFFLPVSCRCVPEGVKWTCHDGVSKVAPFAFVNREYVTYMECANVPLFTYSCTDRRQLISDRVEWKTRVFLQLLWQALLHRVRCFLFYFFFFFFLLSSYISIPV